MKYLSFVARTLRDHFELMHLTIKSLAFLNFYFVIIKMEITYSLYEQNLIMLNIFILNF